MERGSLIFPPPSLLQTFGWFDSYNQCWSIPYNFPVCRHLLIASKFFLFNAGCDERLGWVPSPPTGYCPCPQSRGGFLSLQSSVVVQLTSFRLNSRQCWDTEIKEITQRNIQTLAKVNLLKRRHRVNYKN